MSVQQECLHLFPCWQRRRDESSCVQSLSLCSDSGKRITGWHFISHPAKATKELFRMGSSWVARVSHRIGISYGSPHLDQTKGRQTPHYTQAEGSYSQSDKWCESKVLGCQKCSLIQPLAINYLQLNLEYKDSTFFWAPNIWVSVDLYKYWQKVAQTLGLAFNCTLTNLLEAFQVTAVVYIILNLNKKCKPYKGLNYISFGTKAVIEVCRTKQNYTHQSSCKTPDLWF